MRNKRAKRWPPVFIGASVAIVVWRVSAAGVTFGFGGTRILPAGPVTAFAAVVLPIAAICWIFGRKGRR